jgi:hypothetical protein
MSFYKRRIHRNDTLADVAERMAYRIAADQALAEMAARFPILSAANFDEARRFLETRRQELIASTISPQ